MLSPMPLAPMPFTPLSVLMADADEDTRQMYGQFLRHSGIDLDEASDGREALAKALARPHDVIVTATRLPGISGYQLCELLRRDTSNSDTPIIFVTADALAGDIDRALSAGADTVLVKPCLPNTLLEEVRRIRLRAVVLRQESAALRERSLEEVSRARALSARATAIARRRALSRTFIRRDTTTPSQPPPQLVCPVCDQPLAYQ